MENLISIIVPVYNVEQYLDRCLKSIVNQDYSNLEIILINDGSTDNSKNLCDKWAQIDSRIKVIHQKNKGVSSARNVGLDIATGEFIGFVDPDDEISIDMYSSMLENIRKNNADIVACGVKEIFMDGEKRIYRENDQEIKLDKDNTINRVLRNSDDIGGAVWNKLWRKEKIGNVRFDKSLAIAEDRLFCITVLLKCNSFYRDFSAKYICVKRGDSATQASFSKKRFDNVWSAVMVRKIIEESYSEYVKAANYHVALACMDIVHSLLANNLIEVYQTEYKEVINLLRNISIFDIPSNIDSVSKTKMKIIGKLPKFYSKLWHIKKMI